MQQNYCFNGVLSVTGETGNAVYAKSVLSSLSRHTFVGILELKDISFNFAEGEVWSEIREMVSPMERKADLIPDKQKLDLFCKVAPSGKARLKYV